jgi:tetratricopeptide (TPR) repeat protein
MRRAVTLASLDRRERLLVSCTAVVSSAVAVVALALNERLLLVAAIVALVGASAEMLILARSGRLQREQDEDLLRRRLRVPVRVVDEIDPTAIGVDPAAQSLLGGGEVPRYLPRDVDVGLCEAITAAVTGDGPWLIVLSGRSKVGKSRTLLHALVCCMQSLRAKRTAELVMVAPTDGDAVHALLRPGEALDLSGCRPVLWLDDLEPFVAQEVTWQTLSEWHERFGAVVLATYGGKGSEWVAGSNTREIAVLTDTILQHASEVVLDKTSATELAGLPAEFPEHAREAVESHGLAAIMVAGPALERKLVTCRHAPGEAESPEGAAVVYAAVDWIFCGRLDPISRRSLRRLWRSYLPPGVAPTKKAFGAGLDWALRPIVGSVALLHGDKGYVAFDYVVTLVDERASKMAPRSEAWRYALKATDRGQAFMVGTMAIVHEQFEHAVVAFRVAASGADDELTIAATFNLGVALRRLGNRQEACQAFRVVSKSTESEWAHKATINLGLVLEDDDEQLRAACDAYQRVVDSNDPVWAAPAVQQLTRALRRRGRLEHEHGNNEAARELLWEASSALERVIKLDEQHEDVSQMRFELGVILEQRGISMGALVTFNQVAQSDGSHAQIAALYLGELREKLDNPDGALEAYEHAIELGPSDFSASKASFRRGILLEKGCALREARAAYEQAAESSDEELRFASKTLLALLMEKQGDPQRASAFFREAMNFDLSEWPLPPLD